MDKEKDFVIVMLRQKKSEIEENIKKLNKIFYVSGLDNSNERVVNSGVLTRSALEEYIDKMDMCNKRIATIDKLIARRFAEIEDL